MGRFRPVLATRCTPHRRLFQFSKQFLEGEFSEVAAASDFVTLYAVTLYANAPAGSA